MDQRFLSDCYFYKEDHDMGATIPYCSYESGGSYECPCAIGCEHYISTQEVERLVRKQMLSAEPGIIHCRDCKYYDGRPCGNVDWYNTNSDYCSRAERIEE